VQNKETAECESERMSDLAALYLKGEKKSRTKGSWLCQGGGFGAEITVTL